MAIVDAHVDWEQYSSSFPDISRALLYPANFHIFPDAQSLDDTSLSTHTNTLIPRIYAHLKEDLRRRIAKKILGSEPITAEIYLLSDDGASHPIVNYLQMVSRCEAGVISPDTTQMLPLGTSSLTSRVQVDFETPSGLVHKLHRIYESEQRILSDPFKYILDSEYLVDTQRSIMELESVLGPSRNLLHHRFGSATFSDVPLLFRIGKEKVFLFPSSGHMEIAGVFSTPEKEGNYSYGCDFHLNAQSMDSGTQRKIISSLSSSKLVSVHPAYGEQEIKKREDHTIRTYGFKLLESGSHRELGEKYVKLRLGRMERFTLLHTFAKNRELQGIDMDAWDTIHRVIAGEKDLACLDSDQLVYFVKEAGDDPSIKELLDTLRKTVYDPIDIRMSLKTMDTVQKMARVAQLLAESGKEERYWSALLGSENQGLVTHVAEVMK